MHDPFKTLFVPVRPEGYPFIAIAVALTFLGGILSGNLGWIFLILTAWCVYFFRDPARIVPQGDKLVISPADGILLAPVEAMPPKELNMGDETMLRLSIFMNVFDCHVNRSPVKGTISGMHYYPGTFVNASLDKASENNERQALKVTTEDDVEVGVVQIAGLVARRIVCDVKIDQSLDAGERFGMIRFGSRVDVYLPKGTAPAVVEGQRMIGGETILAELGQTGEGRQGTTI